MEFAMQNGFEVMNVFGASEADPVQPKVDFALNEDEDGDTRLSSILMGVCSKIMGSVGASPRVSFIGKIVSFFSGAINTGIEIIGKAIKVAIFKFGIELCAMSIKSLIETMSGKGLQPPSIDTKGVFYNAGTTNSSQNTSSNFRSNGYNNHQPTLDNPFGNSFGGNPF